MTLTSTNLLHLVLYITEIRSLSRIRRSSYQTFGADMGSIADHSFQVTMIALLLAEELSADTKRVVVMALIHDIAESRTGDANFVHKRYQTLAEQEAFDDITANLPKNVRSLISEAFREFLEQKTLEAKIVKDADILDQLFQEKILLEQGHVDAKAWFEYSQKQLKLPESIHLAAKAKTTKATAWWTSLSNKSQLSGSRKRLIKHLLSRMSKRI